ncbi:hypothetical protein ACTD5D_40220 [Nocardia takedensis]|uniref:hypothetical protein n=1 Tax=Nocardia takedensis TaxID=259390 RepID=UPI003F764E1C
MAGSKRERTERSSSTGPESWSRALSVGQDRWTVDFLPGRTLTRGQAQAAMRVAAELDALRGYAAVLGLTMLEVVGLATMDRAGRLGAYEEAAQVLSQLGQRR